MITAYVKPTNRCNVGCTHCYLPESVRADKSRMSDETLLATAKFLGDMQARGRHAGAHVLWHGGEPLVMRADWYFEAGELLDRVLPGHTESMQTSLIPLRADHLSLIKERFGSFVGSSMDFSQRQINGSVEAYHRLWMKKVDMARAEGITVVAGVVPTRRELGREAEMVRWFVDRDFDAFNIDRYNAYGTYFDDRPSNLQHSYFLMGLFDALMAEMEATGSSPMNGAIRASLTGVIFGVGGDRWGGSCMNDFIVVEPDGALNNCPDKSSFEASFGNVHAGFQDFALSRHRKKWVREQNLTHKEDHCHGCENQHFCQSGCPITPNGSAHGEDECSGYRTFLHHVRTWVNIGSNRDTAVAYLNQSMKVAILETATVYATENGACAA
ncbi:SPASM domain-containing protein [Agrobacterium rubi]|nr:SPASM domain-containing protein [Agrobacterium rubi]NTF24225.1 SPASM domain-containing protein [Agrobacterium rubi]